MILYFKVENFLPFKDSAEMNFEADMRIKRFSCNAIRKANKNILKVAGIYGPNNTGKTCILLALAKLQSVMLGQNSRSFGNAFSDIKETTFCVKYFINDQVYQYDVVYDSYNKQYKYEKITKISIHESNNKVETTDTILERSEKGVYLKGYETSGFPLTTLNIPLILTFEFSNNEILKQTKDAFVTFASSIQFVRMEGATDFSKTLKLFQEDEKAREFIIEFVKNCDLNIDNIGYDENIEVQDTLKEQFNDALNSPYVSKDLLKIYSIHNGVRVPSILIDSVGTNKIIKLAGYIYEAMKYHQILVIDEIDSSLHHLLTRAIISMFNNMLNENSQLIFSTQDIALMDLQKLFRKDQIWLTDINEVNNSSKLISLSKEYQSRVENGLRGNEDLSEYYLKGRLGRIPTPDLIRPLEILFK